MPFKENVTIFLHVAIALLSFVCSVITAWQAVWVLSTHDNNHFKRVEVQKYSHTIKFILSMYLNLLWDSGLVVVFIVQHSMISLGFLHKYLPNNLNITPIQRNIYVTCTCASLQLMMMYWRKVDYVTIWAIDTSKSPGWWWFFTLLHTFAWLALYGQTLVMDLGELIGLKQIYYDIRKEHSPTTRKTPELRRLYYHMRHGGFLCFSIIMWFHPVQRIDRALLTALLMVYMQKRFQVIHADYEYVFRQQQQKIDELLRVQ